MKIGVYTNPERDKDYLITKKLLKEAENFNFQVVSLDAEKFSEDKLILDVDIIMALGGDGTILRVASIAAKHNIPVLGINTGNLGFLTEIETEDIGKSLKLLNENKYYLEKRSMLVAKTDANEVLHALNEIVCTKEDISRISKLDVYFKSGYVDTFWSDGVMISTPTGSTAYSLSVGGPILAPDLKGFAVTAINPHSLHTRPMVVAELEEITLKSTSNSKNFIIADGNKKLFFDNLVTVKKSPFEVTFVRFNPINFYYRLIHKLNKWSTTKIDKE